MTQQSRTHRLIFVGLSALLLVVLTTDGLNLESTGGSIAFGQTAADETPGTSSPPGTGRSLTGYDTEINPNGYTSARVCGRCHTDIYNSWKNSLHAFSLSDPIFDTAYMEALKVAGDEAKRLCLRCHAPMTLVNGDFDLREGVTREGVSCDFCHTVTAVQLDDEIPYLTDVGLVKRSVLKKAGSPKHEVAYSELHGTAEFCGGCHNYVSPNGTPIMSTYYEWRDGPYSADGTQCQDCHMALSGGTVVSKEVKTTSREMHLHDLIHDTEQLRSAVEVHITRAHQSSSGEVTVNLTVKNSGSGHMIPTGMPSRELVLTVTVDFGRRQLTQERRYRKIIADDKGRLLNEDFEALLYGARIISDNRIAPLEERPEHFTFLAPVGSDRVEVTADLSYVYSPRIIGERKLDVELARTVQRVK